MSWLFAQLYDPFMRGMEDACGNEWRRALLADVRGSVLEIGAGTGRNVRHYAPDTRLTLAEPDPHMRRLLEAAIRVRPEIEASTVPWHAERLEADAQTFDAVVSTLVLCSVKDVGEVLAEIRRVLKPNGRFVFLEHVAATRDSKRLAWQRRIDPIWRRVAGNCHLTRDTEGAIRGAGFEIVDIVRESARKALPIVRPTIRGSARV
jgi:ubiquinone/menaquinone biosynthesis C-methylase UbiE